MLQTSILIKDNLRCSLVCPWLSHGIAAPLRVEECGELPDLGAYAYGRTLTPLNPGPSTPFTMSQLYFIELSEFLTNCLVIIS